MGQEAGPIPTASASLSARKISPGTHTYTINPLGDPPFAEVTNVDYGLRIDYNNGASVDLGKVELYLYTPEGRRATIFDTVDLPFENTDGLADSDTDLDHDIFFDGSGGESSFSLFLDGQDVAGNWRFQVVNRSGKTLDLDYFDLDVDYTVPPMPDLIVRDIELLGDARAGGEVEVRADFKNIGDAAYGGLLNIITGPVGFKVEYWVNGVRKGTDEVSLGLGAGKSDVETFKYISSGGEQNVEVRIVGTTGESNTANNRRVEIIGAEHDEFNWPTADGEEMLLAMKAANAVYKASSYDFDGFSPLVATDLGEHYDPGSFARGPDDARFTSAGLFEGNRGTWLAGDWEQQSILMEGETEDGDTTLILAFRGTDGGDRAWAGQTFTPGGVRNHYLGHRPLIEAAIDYANDASNGIDKMIVAGHSLGGMVADLFAAVDAQHVSDDVELLSYSFGSAGILPDVLVPNILLADFGDESDPRVVTTSLLSAGLRSPGYHLAVEHTEDRVSSPEVETKIVPGGGLLPNFTLLNNLHFGGKTLAIDLPNLNNSGGGSLSFGREHSSDLYETNMAALATDALLKYFDDEDIIMAGGTKSLLPGSSRDEYFIGKGGADKVQAAGGDDLMSGNGGHDWLDGGAGRDWGHGGDGNDSLFGGRGKDTLVGRAGDDSLLGGRGADSLNGQGNKDFVDGGPGADIVRGGTGRDVLMGSAGNDMLYGKSGKDELNGGGGNDTLMGNRGGDVYVFEGRIGDDWIMGFSDSNREKIDLSGVRKIKNFRDLTDNHLSDVGGDALIEVGRHSIRIDDFASDDLDKGDFIF
ncbi:MAG: hypothetical protein AcusKO_33180 [Acuticoccus sp.]